MEKTKVFFVVPTLYGGGAERVVSYIPQYINQEAFNVTLIIIGYEKDSTYEVTGIPVIFLNKSRVLFSVFTLINLLRSQKPQVVLSTLSHLNVVMGYISVLFPKTKFIGRHCIVSQTTKKLTDEKDNWVSQLKRKKYKFGLNLLDIVLCQSLDMYNDMQINMFKVPKHKLRIIHNPMRENFELKSKNKGEYRVVKFITVARLVPMKGHERILHAISKLKFPYEYTIVGDGAEKNAIFNLIDQLGIRDKIVHIPHTSEVPKFLSINDLYLQGSYAEGFPNCLIESCSVGTPVIAFRAPGGLNEIIEDGVNGFLVDNELEFINRINLSIEWDAKEVRRSVEKKFNLSKIINDYENMFKEVLN